MSINETLKQKIDELDLDRRFNDAVVRVERTITSALDKAGDYTAGHKDDLESWIDKAGTTVTERTDGRFAEPVAKAQARARLAVEKLAARQDAGAAKHAPGETVAEADVETGPAPDPAAPESTS
jgi:hypothetical protein